MSEESGLARQVADELEIRNLLARLAQLADDGDLNEYIGLFTEDAIWEMPAYSPRRGHEDLLAGARERRAAGTQGPGTNTHHVIVNVAVWLDGDNARTKAYFMFVGNTNAAPVYRSMGVYNDRFVRTAAGWKMQHRQITPG